MKWVFILVFFSIFSSCKVGKGAGKTMDQLKQDIAVLGNDSLEGRATGTAGELKAAKYIAQRFKTLNLQAKGKDNTYFQVFTFVPREDPFQKIGYIMSSESGDITGRNVIGYINNQSENTIIIGAHYDHLGYGGQNSLYREGSAIHNGADDNASGVAVLLDLAKKLRHKNKKNNYLFVAFSGEEMGLLGSNYFVKNPSIPLKEINYMINLDMVGRLNEEKILAVNGTGTSPVWEGILNSVPKSFKMVMKPSGVGPSDHTSFYLNDIPALHFFTGQHADYHKPSDDIEKLNYEGIEAISNYIFAIISTLNDKEKLGFTKTKNESENTPKFKVTLGVVPDYLFDGRGMRIDGVTEGRPAQKAGLQKGDIVVQVGAYEVSDMMSYMEMLSKFEKGQTAKVKVNRAGEILEVEVTF